MMTHASRLSIVEESMKSADTSIRFVQASEFRELAVSHRRMIREDNSHEKLRGLRDVETGELFLVSERALRAPSFK